MGYLTTAIKVHKVSISEYLKGAKYRYVIVNGLEKAMMVCNGLEEAEKQIATWRENGYYVDNLQVMNEYKYIVLFSWKDIEKAVIDAVLKEDNFDGNCYLHYMEKKHRFQYYDYDEFFEIITLNVCKYVNSKVRTLSVYISDDKDLDSQFIDLQYFNQEQFSYILFEILEELGI
jgi:hypothetical protein